jgi:hypothetical protein
MTWVLVLGSRKMHLNSHREWFNTKKQRTLAMLRMVSYSHVFPVDKMAVLLSRSRSWG